MLESLLQGFTTYAEVAFDIYCVVFVILAFTAIVARIAKSETVYTLSMISWLMGLSIICLYSAHFAVLVAMQYVLYFLAGLFFATLLYFLSSFEKFSSL